MLLEGFSKWNQLLFVSAIVLATGLHETLNGATSSDSDVYSSLT